MFSSEEIFEEFVECTRSDGQAEANYGMRDGADDIGARSHAEQFSLLWSAQKDHDDAQKFLDGDDQVREEIRNKPRIIPKEEEPRRVAFKAREQELTLADAESIRVMAKTTSQRELARRYGVHHCTINRIIVGKTYRKETGREFKIHTWEHAKIVEEWRAGASINAIARHRGVERRTIKRILTKHSAVREDGIDGRKPWKEERSREAEVQPAASGSPGFDRASADARIGEIR